jgi:TetR/AcrR family transcriptional repressor of nem operon
MLTRKGRATRERIIHAAAGLIFQQGAGSTTMEQVRESANVSVSQLYHYFDDKMELVRAVIAHQIDTIVGAQKPAFEQLDSMATLYAWRDLTVRIARALQCRGGCPIGSLSAELSELSEAARGDLAAGFARWEACIRSGLEAMHRRGILRPEADPHRLALALIATLQGGILLTQVRRDTIPLEVALDTMLSHIASLTVPVAA